MKTFRVVVEIKVDEKWVADGFDPATKVWKETIAHAIERTMPYAFSDELKAEVVEVQSPTWTVEELEEYGLI